MHFRGPVRIEPVQRWQYVERSRHVWWCSDPTLTGGKNQLQTHRRWASRESLCLWSAQPTGNVNSACRVPSSRPCVTFIEVSTNSPVLGKERSECGWRVQVESGEDSGSGLPSEKGERRALLFPPASFCKHKWGGLMKWTLCQTWRTSILYSSVSVYWEEFVSDWVGASASLLSRLGSMSGGFSSTNFLHVSGRFCTYMTRL